MAMMKNTPAVAGNIWKLNLFNFLQWFLAFTAIAVLFFQENGLSMKEIFILQSAFSVVLLGMEIPSGYFSDRIGRKVSLCIGMFLGLLGFLVYILSYGFWGFLGAEILWGIGMSFISGTNSAILYDTLLDLKKENKFKKYSGRITTMSSFSEGTAAILGGFLATISLRLPYEVTAVAFFLAFLVALTLKEPTRHKEEKSKSMFEIIKFAMVEHAEIRWLSISAAIMMTSGITMFWFIQPYLKLVGIPLVLFGIIFAALRFSTGIFSFFADQTESLLGRKKSLIILLCMPALGYFLLGTYQTIWAIGFFLIFQFTRGFAEPVLQDYVNRLVTSDMRATVLSINSLVGRLFFAFFGPFMGWINDLYDLPTALLMGSGIFAILGIISLFFLHRNKVL